MGLSQLLNQVLPASRAEYKAPAVPVAPTQAPAKSLPGQSVPVPPEWKTALNDAYARYPQVPKGLIEATLMMESSMGTNKTNEKRDFGSYGYLGGHTRDGHFADTISKASKDAELAAKYRVLEKDPGGQYKIAGIDKLATPYAAIQATASVLAKGAVNHPYLNNPSDLYFKTYNANPRVDTPERRTALAQHLDFYKNADSDLGIGGSVNIPKGGKIKP